MAPETEVTEPETPEIPEPEQDSDAALLDAVSAAVDAETEQPETDEQNSTAAAGTDATEAKPGGADESEGKDQQPPAADKKPDEKKPDDKSEPNHVDDPIPDDIKGRTRERMESLIAKVKESSGIAEKATAERDELIGFVNESKATPEQFGQALDYLRMVNSGSTDDLRKALKVMDEERRALARMLGEPVEGVDMLAGYDDLKAAVENGEITPQHAQELASAREAKKLATDRETVANTQRTEQEQFQTALASGKAALNQLEATLKTDPQYAAKRAILIPILKPILAKVHPSQWAAQFKAAYDSVQVPAAQQEPATGSQPMRARQPAGTAAKAATSMEEAMDAGIAQAARR